MAGAVIAVVVVVLLLMLRPWHQAADGAPGSVELPAVDVAALEAGAVSQDLATVNSVLVPEARASFTEQAQPLLPSGSTMTIDADSARGFPDSAATVSASVTGARPGEYVLELNFTDGHWLLASAVTQ